MDTDRAAGTEVGELRTTIFATSVELRKMRDRQQRHIAFDRNAFE